jgi:phospholipid/cholesterol/gamma-HCH transport system permease protein
MKKFTPVVKVKGFATQQTTRLSEKTLEKTQIASIFLAEVAAVFIFISVMVKETFTRDFELKSFCVSVFKSGINLCR